MSEDFEKDDLIKESRDMVDTYCLEDGVIFLNPQEVFNKGIVGFTEDCHHIIYDMLELVTALAESYYETDKKNNPDLEYNEEDYIQMANEWLDYNTIRSLPYMNLEFRPIIMNPKID